jgi:hypothetical protein
MAYLDPSVPNVMDLTPGFSALGDALTEVLKAKHQRQIQERLLAQRQMKVVRDTQAQGRMERRDAADFTMKDEGRIAKAREAMRKAMGGPGGVEEAKLIAGGTPIFDRQTMQQIGSLGIRQDAPNLPPKPQAPTAPAPLAAMPPEIAARRREAVPPAVSGPMGPIAPEPATVGDQMERIQSTSDMVAEEQQRMDAAAHGQATKQFEGAQAAFPGQMQQYGRDVTEAKRSAPTFITRPGQPDQPVDMVALRTQGRKTAADEFLASLAGVNLGENDKAAVQRLHAAISAGNIDAKQAFAALQKERMGLSGIESRERMASDRNETTLEAARIHASRPPTMIDLGERKFRFDQQKERSDKLRKDIDKFIQRFDAKTIHDDYVSVPNIIADLKSTNPQRQKHALVKLWRMAQHDNRMSDRDAIMSEQVDPSWLATIGNWASRKTSGLLTTDVQRIAIDTASTFEKNLGAKLHEMRRLAKQTFIDSGEYDQREGDVVLTEQLPGWLPLTEREDYSPRPSRRRGPPEARRPKGDDKDLLDALGR